MSAQNKTAKELRPPVHPKLKNYIRGMKLSRIPGIKSITTRIFGPKVFVGGTIPINISLGEYEDQIFPLKAIEYFIDKASKIILQDCPCRAKCDCQHYDHSLGCMWLGSGTEHFPLEKWPGAHFASKEEAKEHGRKAYESGLVPHISRFRGDAWTYEVVPWEDKFMGVCYCCSCCCVGTSFKYGPQSLYSIFKRIEGVSVKVDSEKCTGCEQCASVCLSDGISIVEGKSHINLDRCKGCGRCVSKCPNEAITLTIDDPSAFDDLIKRLENAVDVT